MKNGTSGLAPAIPRLQSSYGIAPPWIPLVRHSQLVPLPAALLAPCRSMHSSSFNDLIGLKRAWAARPGDGSGTVDCCLLAAEVHKRLGYYDYTDDLLAMGEENNYTDETFPRRSHGSGYWKTAPRSKPRTTGSSIDAWNSIGSAMGTVLDDGHTLY
jgi:hypothetical protein